MQEVAEAGLKKATKELVEEGAEKAAKEAAEKAAKEVAEEAGESAAKKKLPKVITEDGLDPIGTRRNAAGRLIDEKTGRYVKDPKALKRSVKKPKEAYNREKHYGKTPTKADRKYFEAGKDEVIDHDPPLAKRYYEGDPKIGEKPGWQMTPKERRASANDRLRMKKQSKADSNKQGGEISKYSKKKKKELGL